MLNIDLKIHSDLFNKYYCIIDNVEQLDLYYNGVCDFLKYKFKKILLKENQENKNKLNIKENSNTDNNKNILNSNDKKFLKEYLSKNKLI